MSRFQFDQGDQIARRASNRVLPNDWNYEVVSWDEKKIMQRPNIVGHLIRLDWAGPGKLREWS